MHKNLSAYLQMTLAMAIVGSSVVAGKLIVASFPVFLSSGMRFAISSLMLVPLMLKLEKGFVPVSKREWAILFLQALTGVFLFNIFLLYGVKFTGAVESGIITSTTPAMVGIISFLFLKERLSLTKSLGILFTVLGILMFNLIGINKTESGVFPLLGNLLIFGAVIGEALFTILRKVLPDTVSPLSAATLMSFMGFLMFLPLTVYEALSFDFSAVSLRDWLYILYFGIVVTVVAYILWFQGVAKVPASTAAVFTGVMPVSAVLLAYIVLNEPLSWAHILGGLCVLIGIGFITKQNP
ncbi:MAG: DMT family transporter [Clostridia bacterium]|nr:DMT family transporter [Clostridia bacterium]